ncbi:MAG: hypothetical protein K2K04_00320 [Clostridia bacterium]|nr:hypothetical protein [Clostridia bacterium]
MDGFKKIELFQEAAKFEMLEDYREAFKLYLKSAEQGYARAQLVVAKYYLGDGEYKGIIEQNRDKAVVYLNLAESGGNAEAKHRLALILLESSNAVETARALELLKDAAFRMYYPAVFELIKCYFYGIGCQKDYATAVRLIGRIVYAKGAYSEMECCIGIRKILCEIKALSSGNKGGLNESDLSLLNDLCSDLNIDD